MNTRYQVEVTYHPEEKYYPWHASIRRITDTLVTVVHVKTGRTRDESLAEARRVLTALSEPETEPETLVWNPETRELEVPS